MVVNLDKYRKYVGRDDRSMEGYRNMKLLLYLRSGLISDFLEGAKVCFDT